MAVPWKPASGSFAMAAGDVEMVTFDIPGECICTWSVSKPGPGRQCVSTLRFRNSLCPVRLERKAVTGDR